MQVSNVALVALVLVCVCFLQGLAGPVTQQEQDEHHVESQTPQENQILTETSQEQTNPLEVFRVKRQSHLSLCRFCCKCCRNKGCGYCCRF